MKPVAAAAGGATAAAAAAAAAAAMAAIVEKNNNDDSIDDEKDPSSHVLAIMAEGRAEGKNDTAAVMKDTQQPETCTVALSLSSTPEKGHDDDDDDDDTAAEAARGANVVDTEQEHSAVCDDDDRERGREDKLHHEDHPDISDSHVMEGGSEGGNKEEKESTDREGQQQLDREEQLDDQECKESYRRVRRTHSILKGIALFAAISVVIASILMSTSG